MFPLLCWEKDAQVLYESRVVIFLVVFFNRLVRLTDLYALRLNRNRLEKLRQEYGSEGYKSYQHTYWAFSKAPIGQSFLILADPQVEATACKLFSSILIFSGLLEEGASQALA